MSAKETSVINTFMLCAPDTHAPLALLNTVVELGGIGERAKPLVAARLTSRRKRPSNVWYCSARQGLRVDTGHAANYYFLTVHSCY